MFDGAQLPKDNEAMTIDEVRLERAFSTEHGTLPDDQCTALR